MFTFIFAILYIYAELRMKEALDDVKEDVRTEENY